MRTMSRITTWTRIQEFFLFWRRRRREQQLREDLRQHVNSTEEVRIR